MTKFVSYNVPLKWKLTFHSNKLQSIISDLDTDVLFAQSGNYNNHDDEEAINFNTIMTSVAITAKNLTENIRSLLWSVLINYSDMIDQFAKHAFFDFWYLKKRTIIYWNSLPGQHGQTDRVKFDISNIKTSHVSKVHFFQKIFFVKVWRVYNVGVIKETIT